VHGCSFDVHALLVARPRSVRLGYKGAAERGPPRCWPGPVRDSNRDVALKSERVYGLLKGDEAGEYSFHKWMLGACALNCALV
jgi:hypothetical protein